MIDALWPALLDAPAWVAASTAAYVVLLALPAIFFAPPRETVMPSVRIVRKRKTGRRFQRPAYH